MITDVTITCGRCSYVYQDQSEEYEDNDIFIPIKSICPMCGYNNDTEVSNYDIWLNQEYL